jgi:hypothetical protein
VQLDLGDRSANSGRQWIAAHDNDATERGLSEKQRRQEVCRFVDPQVLDVIDDEHAGLRGQRLGQRARNAAQGPFGAGAQRAGPIARMALDDRALGTEHGCQLGHEPRLAGPECAV